MKSPRSFLCAEELWRAFEVRAEELECSVDWLVCEAMKRLLEHGPKAEPKRALPPPLPPPPRPLKPVAAGVALVVNGMRSIIDRDGFVLGRSAKETHLTLRDPGVSRQHAIIERKGSAHVIVDMASMNGVIVNGSRVSRAVLRPGDVVQIGPFELHVERA